jgi:hypothetical protein
MISQTVKSFPTIVRSFNRHILARTSQVILQSPASYIGAGLFGLFFVVLAVIQFATPDLAGNDGYYHIKIAQIMGRQGLRPPFPWLPLTVLNPAAYVDHHFLYHVLLLPFTYVDLRLGAKWASVMFPALTFLSGWILLRGQRVPYAPLWAMGFLAVSEAFLYRMSMTRAQSLSLLMLMVGLHFTLTGRLRWLLFVSFLYVWLYNAFPLMLMVVGAVVAAGWLIEGKLKLAPLGYSALGLGLGLILNPYFPENLLFIAYHLFPKLTDTTAVSVGNEWYPYETWTLVENSGPALLLFVSGILALGLQERRMNVATTSLLLIAVLFGVMLFKSRRFVEYFPAFALLFAALAWTPLLTLWQQTKARFGPKLPILLTLLLLPAIIWNVQATQESLQRSKPYGLYAAASAWLKSNTPAGSMIFQTDWDDFTRLYFYNTHNRYTVGLDPTYLQLYDAELYDLWVEITKGRVEQPAGVIQEKFGADYVLTDLNHKGFLNEAQDDPRLKELFRDDEAVIFQVLSQSEGGAANR